MGVLGMNSYEIIMIILTALAVIIDLIKMNNGNKKITLYKNFLAKILRVTFYP